MLLEELQKLVAKGESESLEFKKSTGQRSEAAKTVCALFNDVANAICHRDYTTHGGAVAIAMYDDRLEIINPGILHFDMTPEKLAHPHESKPESLEEKILCLLQKSPLSKSELSKAFGHKNISGGLKKALTLLLNQGKITYTLPDKLTSSLQKYKLTQKS